MSGPPLRRCYAALLRLYPAAFRARFERQMLRCFEDALADGGGVARMFIDTLAGALAERWRNFMTTSIPNDARRAAIVALAFALPLAVLLPVIFFEIEPLQGWAKTALTSDGQTLTAVGQVLMVGGMLALPAALLAATWPLWRRRRLPFVNVAIAAVVALLMVPTWGALASELVRCEVLGVANCD